MAEFSGKTAFVVGGSAGIGLAVARDLSAAKARVAVFARNPERLEEARKAIAGAGGGQCVAAFPVDACDPGAVDRAFAEAEAAVGPPDILIQCAGRAMPRPFMEVDHDQFQETLQVNLCSTWNVIRAVVPGMRERGHGTIVATSSMAGLLGVFGYTDYCASKFAIVGFCEALRGELAPDNIQVMVLCPPDTDTPGFEAENRTKPAETQAISAGTNLLTPEQVSAALLKALPGNRFLILPGFESKMSHLAKRFAPGLVEWVMKRTVEKVRRESSRGPEKGGA
ncbi:MAG: SDR family oxidoreductase [Proteobacteria bacterium]|nr:SDR family oxidoreductase [Pseudomonadota bacterium]